MNVVLVHGFLNRRAVMKPLGHYLEAAGHSCFAPNLQPSDATCGLAVLARQLEEFIATSVPANERFAMVGFSMGAVLARTYMQDLSGAARVAAFFSIAGPHAGARTAPLYPSQGARELSSGSAFLADLQNGHHLIRHIPTVCYWSPFDLTIPPRSAIALPGSERVKIPALIHTFLLFDRRLHRDIAHRLDVKRSHERRQAQRL
jgi:triacylglycerol lipase